ncbi:pyridoxal-phosphate dependent enzyme [Streptomyces sp. NPDC088729]|uniref:pyridoxal-phosphate dependent enzyme n=1 Tax=Streptomyces sp. NPDC088729 TaxID=3365876 RepID=UPI0037F33927
MNALTSLPLDRRARGVIGASSGNHGPALALAGQRLRVPVTVVLPEDAPPAKRRAIEQLGATVITYQRREGGRDAIALVEANRHGLAVVPSAEHGAVITGAGTVALEMLLCFQIALVHRDGTAPTLWNLRGGAVRAGADQVQGEEIRGLIHQPFAEYAMQPTVCGP